MIKSRPIVLTLRVVEAQYQNDKTKKNHVQIEKKRKLQLKKKEKGKDEILNHRPITATAQTTDHATGKSTIATTATGTKSISQILVVQNNKTQRYAQFQRYWQ